MDLEQLAKESLRKAHPCAVQAWIDQEAPWLTALLTKVASGKESPFVPWEERIAGWPESFDEAVCLGLGRPTDEPVTPYVFGGWGDLSRGGADVEKPGMYIRADIYLNLKLKVMEHISAVKASDAVVQAFPDGPEWEVAQEEVETTFRALVNEIMSSTGGG